MPWPPGFGTARDGVPFDDLGNHGYSARVCGGTVLFICPHGAGKSRIAAAWFDALAPAGWAATSAGVWPQESASAHAPRLLAGTAASAFLDSELPRPVSAVPDRALVVAIDCPAGATPAGEVWSLAHQEFGEPMVAELRARVADLVRRLDSGEADG
jgi:hypothetical protein